MTNIDKNSTSYTEPSRSDYTEGSGARFDSGKFDVAEFDKDSDFASYGKLDKNSTSYTYDTKN